MLETLVSSRIRRALFEYLLTNPTERFYLRGLAKSLNLTVSPLRRELKRLEHSGLLQATHEGNMLFYTVNTSAPDFIQLRQASQQATAPSLVAPASDAAASGAGLAPQAVLDVPQLTRVAVAMAAAAAQPRTARSAASLHAPMPANTLVGAAGVGIALLVVVASLIYIRLTDSQLISETSRVLANRKAEVTMVPRQASASSGVMRGSRWQISPGGIGGGFGRETH